MTNTVNTTSRQKGKLEASPFLVKMNKENIIKLAILVSSLVLFLFASRFKAEEQKVICSEGLCTKPHDHGELNFHERFHVEHGENFAVSVLKSSANFWEANATGMTFAVIIGGAALSLLLSWKKFETLVAVKGAKGAALGSILGMPLNMCANCSAVTSMGLTSQGGSAEATLGIILGGALLNVIGIVTMFGLFSPSVIISRLIFSVIMILVVVPLIAKWMIKEPATAPRNKVFEMISCYFPEKNILQTSVKSIEDWIIAVGNIAYKLIPLMLLGTVITAIFRVIVPNETFEQIEHFNPILVIICISFIGTLLSIPVLFEILLGTMMLQLGFSNGAIAAMVFTAPSFGLFTVVLTRKKIGGTGVAMTIIGITFLFGILAGLTTDWISKFL